MSQYIYSDEYKQNHRCPNHTFRKIWEQHHKEKIPKGYHIHHLDGDSWNNDIDNLLCTTASVHWWIHWWQGDSCVRLWGLEGRWHPPTAETIKKLSASRKGRKHSEETKRKISESNMGKKHSTETIEKYKLRRHTKTTKQKLSKLAIGRTLSAETKEKISNYQKGKIVSSETRKRLSESAKRAWAKRKAR